MTFSCPSFLAAATSAVMPPQLATVAQSAQFTVLPPLPLPELDELLQPAASSAPLSAIAATAKVFLLRTISPPGRLNPWSEREQWCRHCMNARCSPGYTDYASR